MNKEQKIMISRITISILLFALTKIFHFEDNNSLVLLIIAYLIAGYDVLKNACLTLFTHFSLDETILMSIATIGAFIIRENSEAVFVMIFYQIGELFQDFSYDRSKDSIVNLVDLMPDMANVYKDGKITKVNPENVSLGDTLVVGPYEKVPLDGKIIEGSTTLNTSLLTGESIPRYVTIGDSVASGLINNDKVIKIEVTKVYEDSTARKIVNLIENATEKKSKSENFITSFAKIYTPIVCLIALLTFIIPLAVEFFGKGTYANLFDYGYRALTILVISCPCAILISVPLAFFSGLGSASRLGILIKGSNFIETLSKIKVIAFDKTGTMTKGVFEVVGIHHCKMNEEELVRYVANLEYFSNHPIAKSILRYYGKEINVDDVADVKEMGGRGLSGKVDGKNVLVGNDKLMVDSGIDYIKCRDTGTIVHVAIDGVYEGHILIDDIIKENAKLAVGELKNLHIKKSIMLTGDNNDLAESVAKKIGIDEYKAELLPEGKLEVVEKMILDDKLLFVGDGINDAPCITRSDVGVAMGSIGSDSAIDLADVVIMDDDIIKVPMMISLSKKTMLVVYENIVMSIGVKVLVLILSILGISNMWLAVFSDVGIMIIAVLNSIRMLYAYRSIKKRYA